MKYRVTELPRNSTSRYIPKRIENLFTQNVPMKCLPTDEEINKM